MKQLYFQNTAQNKNLKGIIDASFGNFQISSRLKPRGIYSPNHPSPRRLLSLSKQVSGEGSNIFLIQNKGKGPPGRQRSPGVFTPDRVSNPVGGDNKTIYPLTTKCIFSQPSLSESKGGSLSLSKGWSLSLPKGTVPELVEGHTEQTFYTNINTKFYLQLNFTNMKKQILFLAFFILAALASITDSYGQMPLSTVGVETATCTTGGTDSPLNPKPGKPYNYSVNIGNTGAITGTVTDYVWWATKEQVFVSTTGSTTTSPYLTNMLTTSNGLIATGANYGSATGGTATMSITWSPSTLAGTDYQGIPGPGTPTFVAVMAKGACADNIQVWEINPQPAFTVDITNFDATKTVAENYGNTISSCVTPVVSATYNNGTKVVDMDYGKNTIYYEVVSANFVGSWTPTIAVSGLQTGETASATIYYSYATAIAGGAGVETLNYAADGTQVGTTALGSTVSDTSSGVSFWLALTVDHNKYETLAASTIRVTIDGMDTTGQWDLLNNCDDAATADQNDYAEQVITPRPDIQDMINDPSFNSIVPGTFIPKPNP